MKKILLTGYMASGKTTIALLLSKAAGISYYDLDEIIEEKAGKTISRLFSEDGEIKFRRMEHNALKDFLDNKDSFVLALGGGTPCYANNHEFLRRDDVVSVYLKASIPELVTRLREHDKPRPLISGQDHDGLEEFVAKHLFDRSWFYHQAKHVVQVDGKLPQDIVNEIMSLY
jgi:shikimate kinase